LAAQGWLNDVQVSRGLGNAAMLGDGEKIS
jgi:hypothetical protein